jgi:molybdate transport system substrate-binding protein
LRVGAFLFVVLACGGAVADDSILVAVASNFSRTAAELAERFERDTGVAVRISTGSTGKLYAQVLNGAPYDVLLAADAERPARLVAAGRADARFTYAVGDLVVWSASSSDCLGSLREARRVALANPDTAPYGRAAREYLQERGLWESVSKRAVFGENIVQALQFVATGNAEVGIVARAQLSAPNLPPATCTWHVPADTHAPIEQQAVLLSDGSASAREFVSFLSSGAAREIIRSHGYGAGS